jgi:Neuraminidase (sialidase)
VPESVYKFIKKMAFETNGSDANEAFYELRRWQEDGHEPKEQRE